MTVTIDRSGTAVAAFVMLTVAKDKTSTRDAIARCVVPRIDSIVQGYVDGKISSEEDALKDLLIDVLLYAEWMGVDPIDLVNWAQDAAASEYEEAMDELHPVTS